MMNEPKTENMAAEDEARLLADIVASRLDNSNPLLPQFKRLFGMYKNIEQRSARLAAEHEQLKSELVNLVRSLDLTGRVDGMTGLVNRRDMMERIEREASRANRHQRIFCALLLNIDNFRHINDVHGYNIGDDVLVELARVLRGGVRSEDVCARWGGDEFLILLPETRREGAEAVARKVLESITMTEFKAQKPGIWVTVSIGVRGYDPSQNIHECVFSADKALQQAKRDGKNRYVIAE
ncbi:GGDEF domain-containing protein [Geobacter chapellei]|uniref:diguanylate cyclase n=2 Tax=Pelotalea chapellei TaxID=44671 RepID=A0ABS5UC47_9BACT|nr:GGDEF domain-containing protein [Pelotalea chapellei]MBT1073271.1 GGDEF domain-containing protein [Pelotalea chapellei]